MGNGAHHHGGIEHGMTRLVGSATRGVGDMLAFRGHRHTHMVRKPHGVKTQAFSELGGFYGLELIWGKGAGQYILVIPIGQTVRSRIYTNFHTSPCVEWMDSSPEGVCDNYSFNQILVCAQGNVFHDDLLVGKATLF